LDKLGINYSRLGRNFNKDTLKNYDIVYNCINLDLDSKDVWFSETTIFETPIIIVDISCDVNKDNNPIAIYNDETTWDNPVYSYNDLVDIISISNLPSLLPKDSSDFFSKQCIKLLLNMDSDIWKNNENIFHEKCAEYQTTFDVGSDKS
jgi:saccharopine dehydrogenase (NAD+, L-lysine-forming)